MTKFEKCKFIGFLYNYLYSIKSKMWKSGEAGSDGLLAVSYTLEVLLRHMGSTSCLGDKAGEDQSNS